MKNPNKQCPSIDELQRYISKEISGQKAKIIAGHVQDCIFCTDILHILEESLVETDEVCKNILKDIYLKPGVAKVSMPGSLLNMLKIKESLFTRIMKSIKRRIETFKKTIVSIFSDMKKWWQNPREKVLAPIAVTIAIAIFFLIPKFLTQPSEYADLAIIEKAPYQVIKFKGNIALTPSQQLFADGMKLYNQKKYEAAIQKLTAFLDREPDNAYGNFYLGISLLLVNDIEKAIEFLKHASELSRELTNNLLLEQCYWHLGNAYLKNNDVEHALIEFKNVIKLNGELKINAEKQVKKIEKLKQKKAMH